LASGTFRVVAPGRYLLFAPGRLDLRLVGSSLSRHGCANPVAQPLFTVDYLSDRLRGGFGLRDVPSHRRDELLRRCSSAALNVRTSLPQEHSVDVAGQLHPVRRREGSEGRAHVASVRRGLRAR
jgi:hypothetical protein